MEKVKHNDWLREQLRDPGFAAEYLTAAAEDEEPAVFLQALRKVAETQGMAKVAKRAGIPRESLYRMLSAKGNPRWSTLAVIVPAVHFQPERMSTPLWKEPGEGFSKPAPDRAGTRREASKKAIENDKSICFRFGILAFISLKFFVQHCHAKKPF